MKVVYFLLYFVSVESAKKLPSYVEQCYRSPSSELSKCLTRNFNSFKSRILNGTPELLVPSLNPLFLKGIAALEPNADFRCEVKDIKLWHMEQLTVNKFDMDLGAVKQWKLNISYHFLNMEFDYNMKGKLLVLQLDSSGKGSGNVTGVSLNVVADLTTYVKKNGKEHLSIKDIDVKMDTDSGYFNFENLFRDKEELNERANRIINENFQVFLDEFKPLIENVIESFLEQFFNAFYSKFPYDVLFPEKV